MAGKISNEEKAWQYDNAHEALTTLGVPRPDGWSVSARIDWLSQYIPGLWDKIVEGRERWNRDQQDIPEL